MIPPRSILAAVDFSQPSRTALDFAAHLARQCGAALHVLHAEDPLLAAAAKASGVELSRETREELTRFAESVARPGDPPVHYHIVIGAGTPTICHVAQREQLDVIVMGMHGMSGPARAMFGSTTEGVLRQARASVLVVPDSWVPPRADTGGLSGMGPVVAAIECSEPAIAGAAAACRMAAALGTSVDLVHIVPELPVLDRWRGHADAAVSDSHILVGPRDDRSPRSRRGLRREQPLEHESANADGAGPTCSRGGRWCSVRRGRRSHGRQRLSTIQARGL